MSVLVTGGTGYIGSHTALELLCAGHEVVLLDNYSNSSPSTLAALRVLAGREIPFVEGDVCDGGLLDGVFAAHGTSAVLHFAALKAAGESVLEPLGYYANNVAGTLCLLERMAAHGIRTLVFSSSAAVYGAASSAVTEDAPTRPESPAGQRHLVKRLRVKPGAGISRQRHRHRSEYWVVVRGVAEVQRAGETFILRENESAYIPAGTVHRLRNPGPDELEVVEVQVGDTLSEDDIERLEDDYGRVPR